MAEQFQNLRKPNCWLKMDLISFDLLEALNISFYVLCDAFGKRAQHLFFTRRPKWQNLKITK